MSEETEYSAGDVRIWMESPIGVEFFRQIHEELIAMDDGVHEALKACKPEEAMNYNAGRAQLMEVLDIPTRMMEDCKEE